MPISVKRKHFRKEKDRFAFRIAFLKLIIYDRLKQGDVLRAVYVLRNDYFIFIVVHNVASEHGIVVTLSNAFQ